MESHIPILPILPATGVEVKLVDRPELGYTNADVPYPRGEIAVRSNSQVAQENWLCTEAESIRVADRYISDGYFLTGTYALGICVNTDVM